MGKSSGIGVLDKAVQVLRATTVAPTGLADLCVAGRVKIHIDRVFALDDVPAALAHVGEGRALGKVVIGVG